MVRQKIPEITAVVVDDEPHARENLRILLDQMDDIAVVGLCSNGPEAIACVQHQQPDILFLDVQMPEVNGFDVLNQLNISPGPIVVFVTAYDSYTLRAFDVNAIDYLLKPFDDERFLLAVERAKEQVRQRHMRDYSERLIHLLEQHTGAKRTPRENVDLEASYLKRIVIKSTGSIYFVEVDDIDWVEAAGSYVQLHTGTKRHLLRGSMSQLEQQLDPDRFLRIHRSYLVNMASVQELRPHLRGEYIVILKDGTELKLSRRNRDKLERFLQARIGGERA